MHAIRLRHPWQRQWQAGTALPVTATNPAQDSRLPLAVYQRSFNRPSGLLPEQAVWLVVEPLQPPGSAQWTDRAGCRLLAIHSLKLNSTSLQWVADQRQLRAQIAQQLAPFNSLELTCALSAQPDSPPELGDLLEVRLEIA